jgi:YidC/Oxa1 family membrane protein insertase
MEERRLLLAVALSLLVVTAYQVFIRPHIIPPPQPTASPQADAGAARPATAQPGTTTPAAPIPPPAAAAPRTPATVAAAPVEPVADERERRVEVTTAEAQVAFANRGARPVAWELPQYKNGAGEAEDMVRVLVDGPRSLDFETGDPALDERLRTLLFRASSEQLDVVAGRAATLTFRYADAGLQAEKTLTFGPEPFLVRVSGFVRQDGRTLPARLNWGPGLGRPDPEELKVQGHHPPQAVFERFGAGVERLEAKEAERREVPDVRWAGVESTYFAALLVPAPSSPSATLASYKLRESDAGGAPVSPLVSVALPPGESLTLFVGPKDYHLLDKLGHGFKSVVPVGDWIGPIVVPLLGGMRWIHGYVGNYGWAIILLTVAISLVMAPFRHYSIVNGLKMAKVAPEMRVIQERYRKVPLMDPKRQQMQEEIGALYARHGMNMGTQMMVGCLPMLLTMPFFFAFYRMLSVSIDLRGAAFLWMPDLSHKDPLYLTPILMGVSMLAMARLTPTGGDPSQRRIQMLMPLIFVTFLFAAPAGLNVYWLFSNLCGIAQQLITTAIVERSHAAPAPAATRKARKP